MQRTDAHMPVPRTHEDVPHSLAQILLRSSRQRLKKPAGEDRLIYIYGLMQIEKTSRAVNKKLVKFVTYYSETTNCKVLIRRIGTMVSCVSN